MTIDGRNDTYADRVRAFLDGSAQTEDEARERSVAVENDSGRNK